MTDSEYIIKQQHETITALRAERDALRSELFALDAACANRILERDALRAENDARLEAANTSKENVNLGLHVRCKADKARLAEQAATIATLTAALRAIERALAGLDNLRDRRDAAIIIARDALAGSK